MLVFVIVLVRATHNNGFTRNLYIKCKHNGSHTIDINNNSHWNRYRHRDINSNSSMHRNIIHNGSMYRNITNNMLIHNMRNISLPKRRVY